MDMSLTGCWDCPSTLVPSFVSLSAGVLLLLIAVVVQGNRFVAIRALGAVIAFVASAWLLLTAFASWRFGVVWTDGVRGSAFLTMLFTVTPLGFLVSFGVLAVRRRRRTA